ncbi:hypothetical protein B0T11DRAFT_335294 [Plectosphaerella cucumerina]|uniref:Uncharacterized protein n=1 Tax=Plectosphaerella cucumerina TaxID=40658 RepID=A0A8K0TT03_9PEZI|nr:hypothetical protein B0T11DRAFT_335294 [Plectosphaerella cucumerina]
MPSNASPEGGPPYTTPSRQVYKYQCPAPLVFKSRRVTHPPPHHRSGTSNNKHPSTRLGIPSLNGILPAALPKARRHDRLRVHLLHRQPLLLLQYSLPIQLPFRSTSDHLPRLDGPRALPRHRQHRLLRRHVPAGPPSRGIASPQGGAGLLLLHLRGMGEEPSRGARHIHLRSVYHFRQLPRIWFRHGHERAREDNYGLAHVEKILGAHVLRG